MTSLDALFWIAVALLVMLAIWTIGIAIHDHIRKNDR